MWFVDPLIRLNEDQNRLGDKMQPSPVLEQDSLSAFCCEVEFSAGQTIEAEVDVLGRVWRDSHFVAEGEILSNVWSAFDLQTHFCFDIRQVGRDGHVVDRVRVDPFWSNHCVEAK